MYQKETVLFLLIRLVLVMGHNVHVNVSMIREPIIAVTANIIILATIIPATAAFNIYRLGLLQPAKEPHSELIYGNSTGCRMFN